MKERTNQIIKIFVITIIISLVTACSNTTSKINMTFTSNACLERNYEEIKHKLENTGFKNINVEPESKGLGFARRSGNVSYISIDGRQDWKINDIFDSDDYVIIKYWE